MGYTKYTKMPELSETDLKQLGLDEDYVKKYTSVKRRIYRDVLSALNGTSVLQLLKQLASSTDGADEDETMTLAGAIRQNFLQNYDENGPLKSREEAEEDITILRQVLDKLASSGATPGTSDDFGDGEGSPSGNIDTVEEKQEAVEYIRCASVPEKFSFSVDGTKYICVTDEKYELKTNAQVEDLLKRSIKAMLQSIEAKAMSDDVPLSTKTAIENVLSSVRKIVT